MNDIMGLLYTGESDLRLREMCAARSVAALPLLSRYRLVDFPLSAMVNSGVRNVGVIMQRNYNSLLDHLGSGKEWDLHGKRHGLVPLPPFMMRGDVGVYEGMLDALKSNMHFLRRSKEEYVVISDTDILYTADFEDMVQKHIESKADLTVMYTRDRSASRNGRGRYLDIDETGRVTKLEIDPNIPTYEAVMMEVFCLRRELLLMLVDRAVSVGQKHFARELLLGGINSHSLQVNAYECQSRVWMLDSVESYYKCSMELLEDKNRASLFRPEAPVLTRVRDEMPTRYLPGSSVTNSLLADGCVIEGTVENSILFRSVRIGKGAVVRNSIIMQDGRVQPMAELDHAILDKQVLIREKQRLIGAETYPIFVAKNMTI